MRAVFKLETLQTSPTNKITEKEKVRKTCEITTFKKKIRFFFIYLDSGLKLFYFQYREFSPYANLISANFITAFFQNYY